MLKVRGRLEVSRLDSSVTKARFSLWVKRKKKKLIATQRPPKLESLPPMTEVLQLNVLSAHFKLAFG